LSAVLGFDTATEDTAVCVAHRGEVLYESLLGLSQRGGPQHTTALLEEIERATAAAGGWEAVSRIAVGIGPGSFTGLRVGVATAQGLGFSRGLPVTGVCTLDALQRGLGERGGEGRGRLAVIDARRGEVFAALYSPDGARLWEPLVCPPQDLAERLADVPRPLLAAGSGAVRFRDELESRGVEVPAPADPAHRVAARHVCALAVGDAGSGPGPVAPIYLRPPDAERWRERDTLKTVE
jgi:tRNA threonylcarbamoyladenosine biosynthesis protein TsaB